VKRKLISLNLLNIDKNTLSECNPQTDNTENNYQSKMETITEAIGATFETPVKSGGYFQPTSSFSIRKTKVDEEAKIRNEYTENKSKVTKSNTLAKHDDNDLIKYLYSLNHF